MTFCMVLLLSDEGALILRRVDMRAAWLSSTGTAEVLAVDGTFGDALGRRSDGSADARRQRRDAAAVMLRVTGIRGS